MRKIVREKATAIIKDLKLTLSAKPSLHSTARQGGLSEAPPEPASSSTSRD